MAYNFAVLDVLTFYGPSCICRNDLGLPKTAVIGGAERQRVSSASLKAAMRTDAQLQGLLGGKLGSRTKRVGESVFAHLLSHGVDNAKATEIAIGVCNLLGKSTIAARKEAISEDEVADDDAPKKDARGKKGKAASDTADESPAMTEQLVFLSPADFDRIHAYALSAATGEIDIPRSVDQGGPMSKAQFATARLKAMSSLISPVNTALDVALFGRMFAATPSFNMEAAAAVSHAWTTHEAETQDDFYTAVDDRKPPEDDVGAAFMGSQGFGSGAFYRHGYVDVRQLLANLSGDLALAQDGLEVMTRGMTTVSPRAKAKSFAHHAPAFYASVTLTNSMPVSLGLAFEAGVKASGNGGFALPSIDALREHRARVKEAYGSDSIVMELDLLNGGATLEQLVDFARGAIGDPALMLRAAE